MSVMYLCTLPCGVLPSSPGGAIFLSFHLGEASCGMAWSRYRVRHVRPQKEGMGWVSRTLLLHELLLPATHRMCSRVFEGEGSSVPALYCKLLWHHAMPWASCCLASSNTRCWHTCYWAVNPGPRIDRQGHLRERTLGKTQKLSPECYVGFSCVWPALGCPLYCTLAARTVHMLSAWHAWA